MWEIFNSTSNTQGYSFICLVKILFYARHVASWYSISIQILSRENDKTVESTIETKYSQIKAWENPPQCSDYSLIWEQVSEHRDHRSHVHGLGIGIEARSIYRLKISGSCVLTFRRNMVFGVDKKIEVTMTFVGRKWTVFIASRSTLMVASRSPILDTWNAGPCNTRHQLPVRDRLWTVDGDRLTQRFETPDGIVPDPGLCHSSPHFLMMIAHIRIAQGETGQRHSVNKSDDPLYSIIVGFCWFWLSRHWRRTIDEWKEHDLLSHINGHSWIRLYSSNSDNAENGMA